jgi:hypothetical protein
MDEEIAKKELRNRVEMVLKSEHTFELEMRDATILQLQQDVKVLRSTSNLYQRKAREYTQTSTTLQAKVVEMEKTFAAQLLAKEETIADNKRQFGLFLKAQQEDAKDDRLEIAGKMEQLQDLVQKEYAEQRRRAMLDEAHNVPESVVKALRKDLSILQSTLSKVRKDNTNSKEKYHQAAMELRVLKSNPIRLKQHDLKRLLDKSKETNKEQVLHIQKLQGIIHRLKYIAHNKHLSATELKDQVDDLVKKQNKIQLMYERKAILAQMSVETDTLQGENVQLFLEHKTALSEENQLDIITAQINQNLRAKSALV